MKLFAPLPSGLGLTHPSTLIATWFGVGLLRPAPGSWGSLAALPFGWALLKAGGWPLLLIASGLLLLVGIWASEKYAAATGDKDPSSVVVDEVVGQWIALLGIAVLAAPMTWSGFFLAFILFRVFDITKPWPASLIDRHMSGGTGVMLDDVVAGLYAGAFWAAVSYWLWI